MRKNLASIKRWIHALLTPVPLFGLIGLPRYVANWYTYQTEYGSKLRLSDSYPCLIDWVRSTPFDPHYFYQAAWLARRIAIEKPLHHVDIGSDIRMINVISGFVPTEFLDYRPLNVSLEGLVCKAGNLTSLAKDNESVASLSCLHVVEHIGLGRYGDAIDPDGSSKALNELQRVLSPGGRLYLSVPVGRECVCFNAHRVFDPNTIAALLPKLTLIEFSLVDDQGFFHQHQSLELGGAQEYGCGLFIFEKLNDH